MAMTFCPECVEYDVALLFLDIALYHFTWCSR
jgi:hypothetical protein